MLMSSITWDAEIAGVYDDAYASLFEPSVLGPMTGLLAELARGGPAVEFAVGTGRVALALSARGIARLGLLQPVRPARARPDRCRRMLMRSGPAAGPRWGGERGPAALPRCPQQRRTDIGETSSPAVLVMVLLRGHPVNNSHVHRHMHFSRARTTTPEHQLVTADPAIPACAKSSGRRSDESTTGSRHERSSCTRLRRARS